MAKEQNTKLGRDQLAMIESASVRLRLKKYSRDVTVTPSIKVNGNVSDRTLADCHKARLKEALAAKYQKLSQSSKSSFKKKKYHSKAARYRRQVEILRQSKESISVSFIQFG